MLTGKFQANPAKHNLLQFEIESDQTQVKNILSQLKAVYAVFGDDEGVHA